MKKLTIDTLVAELDLFLITARKLMESDKYGAALHCDSTMRGAYDMFQSVCWALGDHELGNKASEVWELKRNEMNDILSQ